jgi:hypothetical protein
MNQLRHFLRIRCRHYITKGPLILSHRNVDILNDDGTYTEGTHLALYGSITCQRLRFHRGPHQP